MKYFFILFTFLLSLNVFPAGGTGTIQADNIKPTVTGNAVSIPNLQVDNVNVDANTVKSISGDLVLDAASSLKPSKDMIPNSSTLNLGSSGSPWQNLYTSGEAFGLKIENVTSGTMPTSSSSKKGRLVYTTDTKKLYVDDGTAFILASGAGGGISGWVTTNGYAVNDIVHINNKIYKCLVGHTAGTFSTDLAAGKWVELANDPSTEILTGFSSAAGTVSATDSVLAAIQKLDGNDSLRQAKADLTTKGDLYIATASGVTTRQGVGSDGQMLIADSGQTTGVRYGYEYDRNYIANPGAETDTNGWSTYSEEATATITIASPGVLTVPSTFGYYVGMPVSLTTTGALPTGLTANTVYYISSVVSGTTLKLSATLGGADINTSGTQSGTHTLRLGNPFGMVGGAPTSTFTRSTSSPLNDNASFVFSKPAANRMGDGFKYDFTINSADTTKVLRIDFNYTVLSGTYDDEGTQCWVRDQTSGSMIQPSGFKVKKTSSTSEAISMEFQATTSTTYRFGCHIATASTSAYDLKLDKFKISKGAKVYGSPVTDWIEFTPTFGPGFGTVTSIKAFWRRVGSSLEIYGRATSGTVSASGASIVFSSLGVTIDTSKIVSDSVKGQTFGFFTRDAADATATFPIGASSIFTNSVYVADAATNGGLRDSDVNAILASNEKFSFRFTVPILGWSSSVQTSDQADTRVIAASYSNAGVISVTTANSVASAAILKFGTKGTDTHNAYNTTTGQYAIPSPGVYRATCTDQPGGASGSLWGFALVKNGSALPGGWSPYYSSANVSKATATFEAIAGDLVDCRLAYAGGPAGNGSNNGGTLFSSFTIEKISGPSQIAASETVAASYYLSANFAATTTTPINFDTKEFDTHGMCTPSSTSFKCTAPVSGTYSIETVLTSNSGTPAIKLYKNGLIYKLIGLANGAGVSTVQATKVKLLAGEYIDIRPNAAITFRGGTLDNDNSSNMVITRVGNY